MKTKILNRIHELMEELGLSYHVAYLRVKHSAPVDATNSSTQRSGMIYAVAQLSVSPIQPNPNQ